MCYIHHRLPNHPLTSLSQLDDKPVKPADVPDLKISVVSSEVTKAKNDDEFPTWGRPSVHYDVTDARPAGVKRGEKV
jgi:hypothetical protein